MWLIKTVMVVQSMYVYKSKTLIKGPNVPMRTVVENDPPLLRQIVCAPSHQWIEDEKKELILMLDRELLFVRRFHMKYIIWLKFDYPLRRC